MSILTGKEKVDYRALYESVTTNFDEASVTIADLNAKLAGYVLQDKMVAVASKIGFTGDVSALIKVEGANYESVMDAMVASLDSQTKEETLTFQESASEEAEEGTEKEFTAKTQQEALAFVEAEHKLTGGEKVKKAHELFPDIFK